MTNNNYDIWAIQHYPQDITNAIDGLEDSQDNILYSNCRSYLRVGETKIYVQFDTALFCEDKERLILLQKNGELTPDMFRGLLDEKRIPYHEVTFLEGRPLSQDELKEIWFARDQFVLDEALKESKSKGIDVCEYYPDLGGRLELRYTDDDGNYVSFYKQSMRGAVLLDDKIIILMSRGNKRNVNFQQVLCTIYENDMAPELKIGERGLPPKQLPKQYKKEQ